MTERRGPMADRPAFERDGYISPLDLLPMAEAQECLGRFQAIERSKAGRFPEAWNAKPHLLFPWIWELIHRPEIVDPVADLLGPDLLCWATNFAAKSPGDARHVPWHQDSTYWGLSEPRAVTVWLALTASTVDNGCMAVLPGSQRSAVAHRRTEDRSNMLPGHERIVTPVDPDRVVQLELQPGQASIHHPLTVHGSLPNRGRSRRIGVAIRYIAGDLAQRGGQRGTATLVRGRDLGGYDLEQPPAAELSAQARAHHNDAMRRWVRQIFSADQFSVASKN